MRERTESLDTQRSHVHVDHGCLDSSGDLLFDGRNLDGWLVGHIDTFQLRDDLVDKSLDLSHGAGHRWRVMLAAANRCFALHVGSGWMGLVTDVRE